MKALAIPLVALSLALGTPAFAVEEHHPDQQASTATPADSNAMMQRMQENAAKMRDQLDRIAAAKTDEERRAAMDEHMKTMQANMRMAQGMKSGMDGCPMMSGGGMMGMMGGQSDQSAQRMHQMEKRMDMMQMMMERMMRPEGGSQMPMK